MGKNKRFLVLLFLMLALCGCSLVNKTDNSEGEQEEMGGIDLGDVTRDAYFLDHKTIFSAEIPENWYGELMPVDSSKPRIRFTCIDSETGEFQRTNFFYLNLESISDHKNYPKYKKKTFRFIDGQRSIRHTKEYEDDVMEGCYYYVDVLVMPGWHYALSSSDDRDLRLTVERYERNREQIEVFYNSILYQEQEEYVGREVTDELPERERICVHLLNSYLNIEMVVPEGLIYESGMKNYGWECDEFRLRFYLDTKKKNYVEIFSDQTGKQREWIITTDGYQADIMDSGELMYYKEWESGVDFGNEWKGEDYRQITYAFPWQPTGAVICVEKNNEELFGLALAVVKSIQFD